MYTYIYIYIYTGMYTYMYGHTDNQRFFLVVFVRLDACCALRPRCLRQASLLGRFSSSYRLGRTLALQVSFRFKVVGECRRGRLDLGAFCGV